MTTVSAPLPSLEQRRVLHTPIPGPRSVALGARRAAAVAAGVSSTLPVYVARASGAVIEDVDGNVLIDLGSGIAVTSVGASAPEVTAAVAAQAADFTHTCFMISPYEEYVAVCEALARITPGDPRQAVGPGQLRRRGRRERREDRPPRHRPRRRSSCSTTPTTGAPTSRWR